MQLGPFKTINDVITFEKTFCQDLVNNGVAWKQLHEGATILSSGRGHASFINDDGLSKELIMYSKRKIETGEVLTHTYGVSKQIYYQKKNRYTITGEHEFNKRLGEQYAAKMASKGGQLLTQTECEEIQASIKGNIEIREKVLAQCGIIIEMIRTKISPSYWNKLETQSRTFRRGIANRCVLSVIEGIKEIVANPGGDDEVRADTNRETAEKLFLTVRFLKDQQLDPFQMEEHIEPFLQTIWRTKSTWTDNMIIRKMLGKLDNITIYKDIARDWESSQKYAGCDSLELFWRIIQLECETHVEALKSIVNEVEVSETSYMAALNSTSVPGTRKGECFEFMKSNTCKYGDLCRHLHLADIRSTTSPEEPKFKKREASKEAPKHFDERQLRTAFHKLEEERKRQKTQALPKPLNTTPKPVKSGGNVQGTPKVYLTEVEELDKGGVDDTAEEQERDFQLFYANLMENIN